MHQSKQPRRKKRVGTTSGAARPGLLMGLVVRPPERGGEAWCVGRAGAKADSWLLGTQQQNQDTAAANSSEFSCGELADRLHDPVLFDKDDGISGYYQWHCTQSQLLWLSMIDAVHLGKSDSALRFWQSLRKGEKNEDPLLIYFLVF
jgi:hypothetical protein